MGGEVVISHDWGCVLEKVFGHFGEAHMGGGEFLCQLALPVVVASCCFDGDSCGIGGQVRPSSLSALLLVALDPGSVDPRVRFTAVADRFMPRPKSSLQVSSCELGHDSSDLGNSFAARKLNIALIMIVANTLVLKNNVLYVFVIEIAVNVKMAGSAIEIQSKAPSAIVSCH
jgi:hypothetical protein